jgi:ribosomal protein L11 methyltransferase
LRWLELRVEVESEAVEAVSEVLRRVAPGGVAIEEPGEPGVDEGFVPATGKPVVVRVYLPIDGTERARIAEAEVALGHLSAIWPVGELKSTEVAEEDWANAWKEHYKPIRIGRHFLVRPLWQQVDTATGDVTLDLDPGMAFGTGLHPTTQMCLEALEDLSLTGAEVLDVGTGSGILAIGAAKLGAREVYAVDTDSVAVEATRQNVAANSVADRISVDEGSLPLATPREFDVVLANIIARVIIALAPDLAASLRPGGTLVASGPRRPRRERIRNCHRARGALRAGDGEQVVLRLREPVR